MTIGWGLETPVQFTHRDEEIERREFQEQIGAEIEEEARSQRSVAAMQSLLGQLDNSRSDSHPEHQSESKPGDLDEDIVERYCPW